MLPPAGQRCQGTLLPLAQPGPAQPSSAQPGPARLSPARPCPAARPPPRPGAASRPPPPPEGGGRTRRREGCSGACSSPQLCPRPPALPAVGARRCAVPVPRRKCRSRRWLWQKRQWRTRPPARKAKWTSRRPRPHPFSLAHQKARHCSLLSPTCHLLPPSQNPPPLGDAVRPFEVSTEATLKTVDCTCSRYHRTAAD